MNCLVINVVIKTAEWMKCWRESILLPYSSHFDTKTNIKVLYEFSICFPYTSRKDQFMLPLCLADFYESFWESNTIRVYSYFVQFPTEISTNKTSMWVVKWKQHTYGSKTFCCKIYSRHVQQLFVYFLTVKKNHHGDFSLNLMITNESLELGMWILEWRYVISVHSVQQNSRA